jgi:hypothetical protein
MEEMMARLPDKMIPKAVLWLIIVAAVTITAVTVYAVLPTISLNSPTSFPVDI